MGLLIDYRMQSKAHLVSAHAVRGYLTWSCSSICCRAEFLVNALDCYQRLRRNIVKAVFSLGNSHCIQIALTSCRNNRRIIMLGSPAPFVSDAHNLWERLKKHEASVVLFARHAHVPFTNNRAEQDLRMAKVKQKVSGCFRSDQYAHAYCRISSYLQTMANKGYNPLTAIQLALEGKARDIGGE